MEIDLDAATAGQAGSGGEPTAGARPEFPDEDPALIVYTSGTTGRPKGAVLPRRSIASNLDALAEVWGWTDADVVTHGLPLFHVHGLVLGILGPVRRGGTALHLGRFSPEGVREALNGSGTMLFGVPTMYRRLADAAGESPELASGDGRRPAARLGSAALPASEHARIEELTGRGVVERYGMTETLMNTAIHAGAEPGAGHGRAAACPGWTCGSSTTTAKRWRAPTTRRSARSRFAGPTCSWSISIARRHRRGDARRLVCHGRHGHPHRRGLHPDRGTARD